MQGTKTVDDITMTFILEISEQTCWCGCTL